MQGMGRICPLQNIYAFSHTHDSTNRHVSHCKISCNCTYQYILFCWWTSYLVSILVLLAKWNAFLTSFNRLITQSYFVLFVYEILQLWSILFVCVHNCDGFFFYFQPQSPTCLVEDLTEIIKKEQDLSDSQYETDSSLLYSNQVCINFVQITNTDHDFVATVREQLLLQESDSLKFSI